MGLLCLYTHFICYLGSRSRAGSIPARYVSPMAELLRLQRVRPVKRKGLAEKGEERKVNVFYFISLLVSRRFCPGSDTGTISSCWYRGGRICPLAWVYLLFTDHYIGIEKKQVKVADLRCKCDFHCGCVLQHRLAFGDLARFDDSCSHGKERRRENRDDRGQNHTFI